MTPDPRYSYYSYAEPALPEYCSVPLQKFQQTDTDIYPAVKPEISILVSYNGMGEIRPHTTQFLKFQRIQTFPAILRGISRLFYQFIHQGLKMLLLPRLEMFVVIPHPALVSGPVHDFLLILSIKSNQNRLQVWSHASSTE